MKTLEHEKSLLGIISTVRWTGHSHVCRSPLPAGANLPAHTLEEHRDALRELGLNYFGFGHPWEPWDLDLIREWEKQPEKIHAYRDEQVWKTQDTNQWLRAERFEKWKRELTTGDFLFEIDQETPKIRFGHLWWLGWQPEKAPWHDYDAIFDPWQASRIGPRPPFIYRMIPEVIRIQVALGALPVYAHPTSWWFHNGNHITNIASTLVPDILTGQAAGSLVVMGYEADQKHYQELWFGLLNKGYFLTGVAETDASLDGKERFDRAVFQNMTPVEEFSTLGIQDALKRGHNVMTTGLGLTVTCGQAGPGDLIAAKGGRISIHASRLERSHTYTASVIYNGKVIREKTFTGLLEWEDAFEHDGAGWVVVKVINASVLYSGAIANPLFFERDPVRVTGHPLPEKEIRYWENPDAMELCYYLAEGNWRKDFPAYNPGEVPWEAFRWDDWRRLLADSK
jgi:hypothetical protein